MARGIGYLVRAKRNVDHLKSAMEDLKAVRIDVQMEIEAAQREQKQSTHEAKRWLDKVADAERGVTTVATGYEQRGCRLFGEISLNCWLNYKISRRAVYMCNDVEGLKSKRATLEVIATSAPLVPVQEIPGSSNMEPMGSFSEKIQGYLRDDTVGIVGIWGMGGVGKTMLLQVINNSFPQPSSDEGQERLFDHVIWARASKDLIVEKIQKDIAERLKLHLPTDAGLGPRARVIFDFLKNKNFLLLLDDLWEAVDLSLVGIPHPLSSANIGRHKRKVVLTTRSESVCGEMEARKTIRVECLEQEEAWVLFQEKVGEGIIHSHPRIEELARQVARECGGLPLALITIGRAMSTKKDPQQWEHAFTSLKKSHIKIIPDMEKSMFPRLKLSYDSLQDDGMQERFLCCSLWPEDHSIEKEELIQCWMGLGLLEEYDNICEAYTGGHFHIGALQEACLLEPNHHGLFFEERVKMHDVIRDLALWIASESGNRKYRWMVGVGVGARKAPHEVKKWREAERISLMRNEIEVLPDEPFDCTNLSVLMLQGNHRLNCIPSGFFQCISSSLTYLDLSDTGLKQLPKDVGYLVGLKYLNLSGTRISSLPEELRCLVKLRYLFLFCTPSLEKIPHWVVSGMPSLRVLDAYPFGSVDLNAFENSPKNLKALGVCVKSLETIQQLQPLPTWHLQIEEVVGLTILQLQLLGRDMAHCLQRLCIFRCDNLEKVVIDGIWAGEEVTRPHPKLESLELSYLNELQEIVWKDVAPTQCLQSLRKLQIFDCPKLKHVTWVLQLPSLVQLSLRWCEGMEQVISKEATELLKKKEGANLAFPRLRWLELEDLPKLVSISDVLLPFPSLEDVEVNDCPELRCLPFCAEMADSNKLLKIQCSTSWWEALNWEDDSIKSSFQPFVTLWNP